MTVHAFPWAADEPAEARLRRGPSMTDLVADELYRRVVELDLPPGAKLSELDWARRLGVSRQPVRDAFYRLSQIGLLEIQPQRATRVTCISEAAVLRARFVRTALELETTRAAAQALTPAGLAALEDIVERQGAALAAGDRSGFHALDEAFHHAICAASGHEFAWRLIRDTKAHMDRVRFLTLGSGGRTALEDHGRILDALRDQDAERGALAMRAHLARIDDLLAQVRIEWPAMISGEPR